MQGHEPGPGPDDAGLSPGLRPGTVVVTLPDELTIGNADQVRLDLAAAFGPGVSTVVADGTSSEFCDSAGMRELVIAHKHATATGAAFRVVVSHHYMRDRLIRTGLASFLSVYPNLTDALAGHGDHGSPDRVS